MAHINEKYFQKAMQTNRAKPLHKKKYLEVPKVNLHAARGADCPICSAAIAIQSEAFSSHFRMHIKKGEGTTEQRNAWLKQYNLWRDR